MNAQVNADASLQAHLQNAAVVEARASGMRGEWRIASYTVRFSAICLAIFYLLAAASPFFASYDPTYQNRTMPDCPPMALHLSAPSEWYVLCELSSSRTNEPLDALLEKTLAAAHESGLVADATVALSERERELFWRLRESIPEAQRKDGASLKHDISVPVSQVPRFIERAGGWVAEHIPQGVLIAYGHLGDGNLHFNINQRAGAQVAQLQAVETKVKRAVHDFVREFGGSFSAEHGIGQLKVFELERYADPVELELMRRVKQAFDPNGIMNPGKVLTRN